MTRLWWLVHKDLVCEFRARCVWPSMLLVGIVVALVLSIQMELLPEHKQRLVGGLMWLAIFFAGMTAIDRSFAGERDDGRWDGLRLFPGTPVAVYAAKLLVNSIALGLLQCLVVPLFFLLSDLPLWAHPGKLLLVAALGNLGISAVGSLASAVAAGMGRSGNLLVLIVLPLIVPVMLAAAEATRLIAEDQIGVPWWRWIQLLAAFVVVFVTVGALLYEFAVED